MSFFFPLPSSFAPIEKKSIIIIHSRSFFFSLFSFFLSLFDALLLLLLLRLYGRIENKPPTLETKEKKNKTNEKRKTVLLAPIKNSFFFFQSHLHQSHLLRAEELDAARHDRVPGRLEPLSQGQWVSAAALPAGAVAAAVSRRRRQRVGAAARRREPPSAPAPASRRKGRRRQGRRRQRRRRRRRTERPRPVELVVGGGAAAGVVDARRRSSGSAASEVAAARVVCCCGGGRPPPRGWRVGCQRSGEEGRVDALFFFFWMDGEKRNAMGATTKRKKK